MSVKFSIIIPIYNVAPYLRECLDSVLAQTYTDWEAICVDDGSTDGSGQMLDEYAARDSRFIVRHKSNNGVSSARNDALENVRGEWIVFLDGDDILLPGALSFAAELTNRDYDVYFLSNPIDFSTSRPENIEGSGNVIDASNGMEVGFNFWLRHIKRPSFPVVRMMRSSLFADVRFPTNITMMEDDVHLIACLRKQARWAVVDKRTYGYRRREGSASYGVNLNSAESSVRAVRMCLQMLHESENVQNEYAGTFWNAKRGVVENYLMLILSDKYEQRQSFLLELRDLRKAFHFCRFGPVAELCIFLARHGSCRWADRILAQVYGMTLALKSRMAWRACNA